MLTIIGAIIIAFLIFTLGWIVYFTFIEPVFISGLKS